MSISSLEVERLPDQLWNFLRDCPYCVLLFWILAFDLEKEFCGTQIVHIYHRLHINLRTLKKSCTLIFLCLPMPKSLPGLTQYNSTVDLIKSIFPFQKLLWWWMWQREFWWNATLPWSRCSPPSTEILLPFVTFQFLLHLDEKFTLGSKFIIQVTSSISCQSPKKHLFSGSWRDPLVHLSRRAGTT